MSQPRGPARSPRSIALIFALMFGALLAFAVPEKAHALACSASVTDVDFGAPNLLTASTTDALATVTVTCTGVPFFAVVKMCPSLQEGSGGSNGSARLMALTASGGALSYQLYQDSSRTAAWGAVDNPELGTVPVMTIAGSSSGTVTATRTIYARLFGGQSTSTPGGYNSTFAGAETAFSYSTFLFSASGGCTGFVGTAVIHPEFDVLAAPSAGCTVTAADLSFPVTGVLSNALAAQTSLRVSCTRSTALAITLDNGRTGTGPTARKMTSAAGAAVTYGLYRDTARTAPWGVTSTQNVKSTGTGAEQTFVVYGAVPAQATPAVGAYSDRVIVTVTY